MTRIISSEYNLSFIYAASQRGINFYEFVVGSDYQRSGDWGDRITADGKMQ